MQSSNNLRNRVLVAQAEADLGSKEFKLEEAYLENS
jgi:hypothetical protein